MCSGNRLLGTMALPALLAGAAVTLVLVWGPVPRSLAAGAPTAEAQQGNNKNTNPSVGGNLSADPNATGTLTGIVLFKGKRPEMKPYLVPKDHQDAKVCHHEIPYETHVIGPGNELANVVVSLGGKTPLPRGKPRRCRLDNAHCRFAPHVQATTARSKLLITSQDPILHSALAVGAAAFNVALPNPRVKVTKRLPRAGWVIITCSTHSWMKAHIWVFKHDFFAVTGKDGKFTIKGIPPGEYEATFWQEATEPQKRKLKIEAGKKTEVKVELSPYK